jgi:hypothetical protein
MSKVLTGRVLAVAVLFAAAALQHGCGTIVGNPKKPPTDSGIVNPVVYQLPLIDFSVPESATTDDAAGLLLTQNTPAADSGQKTVLLTWARRLDRSLREINRLSERINKIAGSERAVSSGETLTFKGKGPKSQISAKIQPLAADPAYQYEAVLCFAGKVVSHVRWAGDGSAMEVTRDFSAQVEDGDSGAGIVTRLVLQKSDTLTMDLASFGTSPGDLPDDAGKGFAERARVSRAGDGEIGVRVVADMFTDAPAEGQFDGDYYLTGRMTPDATTGGKPFDQSFVAYYTGYKVLCKNGFDETAADLWSPDFSGPRFCLGRPAGRKKFDSLQDFVSTVSSLESVGIISKDELAPVAMAEGLSCE